MKSLLWMIATLAIAATVSAQGLNIDGVIVDDDFSSFDSNRYILYHNAVYDAANQSVRLTPVATNQAGRLYLRDQFWMDNFTVQFDFYMGGGSGADGIVFAFTQSHNYGRSDGGSLDFAGATGYGIVLNTYSNAGDPSEECLGLVRNGPNSYLSYWLAPNGALEGGIWRTVRVTNESGHVRVWLDDTLRINYQIANYQPFAGYFGFTAATGGSTNYHRIDNFFIENASQMNVWADLECRSITTHPPQPFAGQSVTVSAEIVNSGDSTVPIFLVDYYESPSGAYIGSDTVPGIRAGGQFTSEVDWTPGCGTYNLTVEVDPRNLIPEASELNNTFSATVQALCDTGLQVIAQPQTHSAGIDDTVSYNILVANRKPVPVQVTLEISGLPSEWYASTQDTVWIEAWGERNLAILVRTPTSCGAAGRYPFVVSVNAVDLSTTIENDLSLEITSDPHIIDLLPANAAKTSTNSVWINWTTLNHSTSVVYYRIAGTTTFSQATAADGRFHNVELTSLNWDTQYEWYCQSVSACGSSLSEIRHFRVGHGIVFLDAPFTIIIGRDYNQERTIAVMNEDNQPHTLLLEVINSHSDLIVGFIGSGSMDEQITLQPGESRDVTVVFHTQDATSRHYDVLFRLLADAETVTPISALAPCAVDVTWPVVDFRFEEVSFDSLSMIRTLRVCNDGDQLSDLNVFIAESFGMSMTLYPNVNHASLQPGECLQFAVIPNFPDTSSGRQGCSALLTATAAGVSTHYRVEDCCHETIYEVHVPNVITCQKEHVNSWYCTNRPYIRIYLSSFVGGDAGGKDFSEDVTLNMHFATPAGWQPRPHDVQVFVNGHSVAQLLNGVPKGDYSFSIDPAFLNSATTGAATNIIELSTQHLNGGHYVLTAGAQLCRCVADYSERICAATQQQAVQVLLDRPYLRTGPEGLSVAIQEPLEGAVLSAGYRVNLRAQVNDQTGAPFDAANVLVTTCDGKQILLGHTRDGEYQGTWVPGQCLEQCGLDFVASACGTSGVQSVGVVVQCPVTLYHLESIEPAYDEVSEIMHGGILHRYYRVRDVQTTQPVEGVTLYFADGQILVTDSKGEFTISLRPDDLGWRDIGLYVWDMLDHVEFAGQEVALDELLAFNVDLQPRTYTREWDLLAGVSVEVGGGIGAGIGPLGIRAARLSVSGSSAIGGTISAEVSSVDPLWLTYSRRIETSVGAGLSVGRIPALSFLNYRVGGGANLKLEAVGNQSFSFNDPYEDSRQTVAQSIVFLESGTRLATGFLSYACVPILDGLINYAKSHNDYVAYFANSEDQLGASLGLEFSADAGCKTMLYNSQANKYVGIELPNAELSLSLMASIDQYKHSVFGDNHEGADRAITLTEAAQFDMSLLKLRIGTGAGGPILPWFEQLLPYWSLSYGGELSESVEFDSDWQPTGGSVTLLQDDQGLSTNPEALHDFQELTVSFGPDIARGLVSTGTNLANLMLTASNPAGPLMSGGGLALGNDVADVLTSAIQLEEDVKSGELEYTKSSIRTQAFSLPVNVPIDLGVGIEWSLDLGVNLAFSRTQSFETTKGAINGQEFNRFPLEEYEEDEYLQDDLSLWGILEPVFMHAINAAREHILGLLNRVQVLIESGVELILQTQPEIINGGAQLSVSAGSYPAGYTAQIISFAVNREAAPEGAGVTPYRGRAVPSFASRDTVASFTSVGEAYEVKILGLSMVPLDTFVNPIVFKIVVTDSDLVASGYTPADRPWLKVFHWDRVRCISVESPSSLSGDTILSSLTAGGQYVAGLFGAPVDLLPPVIDSLSPEHGAVIHHDSPILRAFASDTGIAASGLSPVRGFAVLDQDTIPFSFETGKAFRGCFYAEVISPLGSGEHRYRAHVFDNAGNQTVSSEVTFIYSDSLCDSGRLIVRPEPQRWFFQNSVPSFIDTLYIGDLGGCSVSEISTINLTVLDSVAVPVLTTQVLAAGEYDSSLGFNGDVLAVLVEAADLIAPFGEIYDTTVQEVDSYGTLQNGEPYRLSGKFLLTGHLSGDLNNDGLINLSDLSILSTHFFTSSDQPGRVDPIAADFDRDGQLTISDICSLVRFVFRQ